MQPTLDQVRNAMRRSARRRMKEAGGSYSAALFHVRRKAILRVLSANPGRYLPPKTVAHYSGVPAGATRNILRHLEKAGHPLYVPPPPSPEELPPEVAAAADEQLAAAGGHHAEG